MDFLNRLIMSDEAHFHLNRFVNKQNSKFWGTENPNVVHERELYPIKCTVWCVVTSQRIIGPYFFEDEDMAMLKLLPENDTDRCFKNFYVPLWKNMPEMWFQQDGATVYIPRATIQLLRTFGNRIILEIFRYSVRCTFV
ncbi:unnamed protein product [Psylliodes chrysocephalus]|uniref:Uncharacterized protein n=1 Tax=Psylliodes chrysocephalus TaxID=3402493 RepID=A0A9P0CW13_9CUCU|nr:unnamed protein product [Psylliodes chrysocephala]